MTWPRIRLRRTTTSLLVFQCVVCLVVTGLVWLKRPKFTIPPQTALVGEVWHPTGGAVFLRDRAPSLTGYSYDLGAALFLVPAGTSLTVTSSVELPNKEIWYQVKLTSKHLRDPVTERQINKGRIETEGWIIGKGRLGISVRIKGAEPIGTIISGFGAVSGKGIYLSIGCLFALMAWKILSNHSFDERKWNQNVLLFEAGLLVGAQLSLLYVITTTFGSADGFHAANTEPSEFFKVIRDFGVLLDRSRAGAVLVGFLGTIALARIFSVGPKRQSVVLRKH